MAIRGQRPKLVGAKAPIFRFIFYLFLDAIRGTITGPDGLIQ
jgi:hypothetical protein